MTQPESCIRLQERSRENTAQLNSESLVNSQPSANVKVELAAKLLAESAITYERAFRKPEESSTQDYLARSRAQSKADDLVESRVKAIEFSQLDTVLSRANFMLAQTDSKFSHAAGETWLGTRRAFAGQTKTDDKYQLASGLGVAPVPIECRISIHMPPPPAYRQNSFQPPFRPSIQYRHPGT